MTDGPDRGSLPATRPDGPPALRYQRIALVDLLDRVLAGGVVVMGEVRLAIADVDLVTISLRALISSVSTALAEPDGAAQHPPAPGNRADDW
jgi:hypothetical protein